MKYRHLLTLVGFGTGAMVFIAIHPDIAWPVAAIANGTMIVAFLVDWISR